MDKKSSQKPATIKKSGLITQKKATVIKLPKTVRKSTKPTDGTGPKIKK
ncbi:MAG: hypothetical protein V1903_14015 [Bacteroidota bacterium]